MRVSSKSPVLRWLLAVALAPAALSAGGHEVTREAAGPSVVASRHDSSLSSASDQLTVAEIDGALVVTTENNMRPQVPFCPEGEKVKCTLGPPPVCHCE
jgi:hypothetical protein